MAVLFCTMEQSGIVLYCDADAEEDVQRQGEDMEYLKQFLFPDKDQEFDFFLSIKRKCYTDFYPFQVLSASGLCELTFGPVTILHGGNGSGKTTALNVIAEKLGAKREAAYNKSSFFGDYVQLCEAVRGMDDPTECLILTSDDVFDYMLDLRSLNEGIDRRREEMFDEYLSLKYADFRMESLNDYDRLKKINESRRHTQSRYVRDNLMANAAERSNGESAFMYFTQKIKEDGLYLLDEPENSLSPARQLELVQFIEESVRFFHCQFIIAAHSPFLLALSGARIYDMDENPVMQKLWTELGNVRQYYSFFKKHEKEFEQNPD